MEITVVDRDTCTVVRVKGQLDRTTADQLDLALRDVTAKQGKRRLVVDLAGVPDMSSAGLRVLIGVVKALRGSREGGDLRLSAPGKRVVDVLELAGLLSVLKVFASEEEAVASFASADNGPATPHHRPEFGSADPGP